MNRVTAVHLGLTPYRESWDLQREIFNRRQNREIGDALLLTEHPHVYTLGKSSDANHLLAGAEELQRSGVEVYPIERGGDITYHGPGQLVGYPILDLQNYYTDLHRYLRDLEEVIIRTLDDFGIAGHREQEYTGVWVGDKKIAAIGVKVSRWITMHGFALNVNTDLSYFNRIIPCGIFHKGVISMEQICETPIAMAEVQHTVTKHFAGVFGVEIIIQTKSDLLSSVNQLQHESAECQR
jgi:lipoate-protein ligase B